MEIRPFYKGSGMLTGFAVQTGRISAWEPRRQNGLMTSTPFPVDGEEWLQQTIHPTEAISPAVPSSSVLALPEV